MKRSIAVGLSALACAVVFVSPTACGLGKVAQCNKLIETANSNTTKIKDASNKLKGDDVASIEALAKVMDQAGQDILKVEVRDEKLKGFAKDYQGVLGRGAQACRDMAAAAKAKNLGSLQKAKADLDKVGKDEDKVVDSINGYCTGR